MKRCKFCRCSERHPCRLVAVEERGTRTQSDIGPYILAGAIAIVPPDAKTYLVPCAWLLDDVCTNPHCVEKAYSEAREVDLVEAIQGLVDLGLVEISARDDGEDELLLTDAGKIEAARSRRTA